MIGNGIGLSRRMALLLAMAPVCFLGAMVAAPAAAGENYALIATVSDYPNLDAKYWLKGPKNDAVLVRDYLLTSSPVPFTAENVTTLGSGEGLQLATHDAILGELANIAAKAKAGDFVFLQFSGHGSQQPARDDKTEADGKDEIFLAADTRMAPSGDPFLPNVITDDEFAKAFLAIRKTGAFVWLVFDSCHSGTITRGAPDEGDLVMRDIKPSDLGIPDDAFTVPAVAEDESADRAIPLSADIYEESADGTMGGLVAFFAAQSTETTPEKGYEVTLADGSTVKQNYGVFTHTIFSALAKNPAMTYRQLAQSVLADYAAGNVLKPTPLFEGQLDTPIFGGSGLVDVAQWPTVVGGDKSLTISAGQLHGLSVGTKLLVLPSPASPDDEATGVVEVASNDQLRSKLVGSSDAKHALIDIKDIKVGSYVRLAEQAFPFELTVAKPDPATSDPAQLAAVDAALAAILANDDKPMRLKVVEPGEAADVRLAVYSEQQVAELEIAADRAAGISETASDATDLDETPLLWLLPASGDISLKPQKRSAAMDLGETDAGDFTTNLSQNLVTIFRATSLSRLSQANSFKPKDFKLSFGLQPAGSETIGEMVAEQTPVVRPGDRIYVDFTNSSGKAADINVLYIDHDNGITLLCQSHLANGDRLFQPLADLNETDKGTERIVTVINESGKDLTDLSFLTQRGVVVRTRGPEDTSLIGMLADLGSGLPTRGPAAVSTRDTKQPRGAVVMVPVEALVATGKEPAATIALSGDKTPEGSCAGQ
jgi:hypothetical protein